MRLICSLGEWWQHIENRNKYLTGSDKTCITEIHKKTKYWTISFALSNCCKHFLQPFWSPGNHKINLMSDTIYSTYNLFETTI